MKTFLIGAACSLLLMILTGCNGLDKSHTRGMNTNRSESCLASEETTALNELLGNASVVRSSFTLYTFVGETLQSKIVIGGVSHRQGMVDELSMVPVERITDWTLCDITLPIFGIELITICGHPMRAAWSNGFWITQLGFVYRFDFDFAAFVGRQQWGTTHSGINFTEFPNARHLVLETDGWRPIGWRNTFLTPAAELNPPDGIEMAFVSNTIASVTYTLTNSNDVYWFYGAFLRVDALLDGIWFKIPKSPTVNWAYVLTGVTLEAGQTVTHTARLGLYGLLPPGTYRLVVHDMYVVFDI